MDHQRLMEVQRALQESNLDGIVARLPENVVLLTGYWPFIGRSAVVVPAAGEPVLIAPAFEKESLRRAYVHDIRTFPAWRLSDPAPDESMGRLLADVLRAAGLVGHKRIGSDFAPMSPIEDVATTQKVLEPWAPGRTSHDMLSRASAGAEIVDATPILLELRSRKTPLELERIRLANEIAGFGIEAFRAAVRPGRRDVDIAAEVEGAILRRGTGYKGTLHARAQAMVCSGTVRLAEVGWAVAHSSDRLIQDGDLVLLELSVVADGYYADLTRMRCAGQPGASVKRAYDALKRALDAAIAAVRPGARAAEVDAAARSALKESGVGHLFIHHTGHGVGLRYHEPRPFLHPSSTDVLEPGMVTSIEPGVYGDEIGGMRLEQNVAVKEDGCEVLSPFPLELEGDGG